MKRFLIVPLLAMSVGLGGCAQLESLIPLLGPQFASFEAQVQAFALKACGFKGALDAIGTVVSALYPLGAPIVGGVEAVANAICSAPAPVGLRRGSVGSARVVSTPRGPIVVPAVR